jgi:hypothetical protein
MKSARETLQWMKTKASDNGDVLFRGQNRVWRTVKPSITRDDAETRKDMWTLCRWFQKAAAGITGYSIPNEHDRLAILQHYIGRSPVIDLTVTPEIALYFALSGAITGSTCVVYSLDRSKCTSCDVTFSDHSFLALPLKDGGMKHRWLRQYGYSVGPTKWRDVDEVQNFDFLRLPGVDSVSFTKDSDDDQLVSHLGDLEDTSSDPLALKVRGVVNCLKRSLNLTGPGLGQVLEASKTRDPHAELAAEIEALIAMAKEINAPIDLLNELQNLRSSAGKFNWDTSFDCTLAVMREKIGQLASRSGTRKS